MASVVQAAPHEPAPEPSPVAPEPSPAAPEPERAAPEASPVVPPPPTVAGDLVGALQQAGKALMSSDRTAEALLSVLGRALEEARGGGLSDGGRRTLQTALRAAAHNRNLSADARTALDAVTQALNG